MELPIKKFIPTICLATILLLSASYAVNAQDTSLVPTDPPKSATERSRGNLGTIGNITGLGTIQEKGDVGIYDKIALIANIALSFVGIIASAYLIYAGFRWITARGNEEQITEAKGTIKSSIIGLVVVFISYVVVNFVVTKVITAVIST
jgi:hypothetical protein